jgi:deoxyhypusine synthase
MTVELERVVEVEEENNSKLKEMLLTYVGEKIEPENQEVTVEMIVETMAQEFPEFLMVVAEENWIRGYKQALTDVTVGEQLANQNEKIS